MAETVKGKRSYYSPRRQQQAAATRRTILERAQELFERHGYAATTMEAIAAESGVALKTVYVVFDTKSRLLRAVWDLVLKGDETDEPVAERPWYREVLDEQDAERQLRLNARNSRDVKVRIAALLAVIRDAAQTEPDIRALWSLIQSDFYDNQRAIVEAIHERGGLRDGLDPARAADILWTLNHPDVWLLLVGTRGWTPEQFESWLADTTCHQLIGEVGRHPSG